MFGTRSSSSPRTSAPQQGHLEQQTGWRSTPGWGRCPGRHSARTAASQGLRSRRGVQKVQRPLKREGSSASFCTKHEESRERSPKSALPRILEQFLELSLPFPQQTSLPGEAAAIPRGSGERAPVLRDLSQRRCDAAGLPPDGRTPSLAVFAPSWVLPQGTEATVLSPGGFYTRYCREPLPAHGMSCRTLPRQERLSQGRFGSSCGFIQLLRTAGQTSTGKSGCKALQVRTSFSQPS